MRPVINPTAPGLSAGQAIGITGYRGGFTDAVVTAVEPHSNSLGGRWVLLSVRLPSGEEVTVDSRSHVFVGPEQTETAWCPQDHRRVEVEDRHDESRPTARGEETVTALDLSCGHTVTADDPRITGPAPGAPYAGPQTAVARSTSLRDRQDARAHQARIDADPWAE